MGEDEGERREEVGGGEGGGGRGQPVRVERAPPLSLPARSCGADGRSGGTPRQYSGGRKEGRRASYLPRFVGILSLLQCSSGRNKGPDGSIKSPSVGRRRRKSEKVAAESVLGLNNSDRSVFPIVREVSPPRSSSSSSKEAAFAGRASSTDCRIGLNWGEREKEARPSLPSPATYVPSAIDSDLALFARSPPAVRRAPRSNGGTGGGADTSPPRPRRGRPPTSGQRPTRGRRTEAENPEPRIEPAPASQRRRRVATAAAAPNCSQNGVLSVGGAERTEADKRRN